MLTNMKHIGISLRFHDSYDNAVARGIIRFAKGHPDWSLHGSGSGFRPLQFKGADKCDALIARIESEEEADRYARLGIPVVDIAGAHVRSQFLRVQNDDFLTGRRAGEYLRRLGARSYAFCGVEKVFWSRQRLVGFAEAVAVPVDRLAVFERSLPWWHDREAAPTLLAFLKTLHHPVALFCCNDIAGVKVSEHCRLLDQRIPVDVTLLGVDDEDLLCELSTPSLSSVRLDLAAIGFRAAELIENVLNLHGEVFKGALVRIPPKEVVERESTTVILEGDPVVAAAVRFIRENALKGIKAADVMAHSTVSRRNLEQRFRNRRNSTVLEEINAERLDNACRLLKSTNLTVETIAQECGFPSAQRFYIQFKHHTGMSPGQWRKRVSP